MDLAHYAHDTKRQQIHAVAHPCVWCGDGGGCMCREHITVMCVSLCVRALNGQELAVGHTRPMPNSIVGPFESISVYKILAFIYCS